ncbi:MAG: ribosome recycling factor [Elusimicrobia bacterium]|nr:ribosome recycling factor [Elusimicrobiota bacterium]MDE2238126.1 ribosome recycling factor [Elusimicrobiota bacterium]MDE2425481.1 ribosome recycling factor [Elusimicrobiota bacterium]
MEAAMKERLRKLGKDFSVLRTGRANPLVLDSVRVEYYGQEVPLKQVAAVSVPEARVLEIRPWDPSALTEIEKAIQKADLGAMPQNDGKMLRLTLPTMTEERRRDMVKLVKKMGEEFRVGVRNDRRDALEKIKKAEKLKELSEDEAKGIEGRIQKATDSFVKQIDEAVLVKEKEIATI